jgi:sugar phosphate isomerase/epimerase
MSITRRDFTGFAAGALLTAGTSRLFAAPATPKKGASRVTFGVQSYSFRDRPLDAALDAMAQIGLATCELWQGHLEPRDPLGLGDKQKTEEERQAHREAVRRWRLDAPLDEFKKVGAKFKKAGVPLCAYNYSFKDDYTDVEIERGFAMAKALGVKAITASAHQNVVARVAPLAKKHRIKVAMHNHSRIHPNEFATPEDFEKAMTGPGREFVAVNLDIGHFTAANFDSVPFIQKHHKRIVTLHIKDRKRDQGPNVPFGEGDTPIREVLALLRDKRWPIPANIEYEYQGGDTVEEIKRCLDYCRKALVG